MTLSSVKEKHAATDEHEVTVAAGSVPLSTRIAGGPRALASGIAADSHAGCSATASVIGRRSTGSGVVTTGAGTGTAMPWCARLCAP